MGAGSTPKSGNDKYYDDGTHPWLNTGDVQNCIISSPQNFITDLAVSECNMKYFTSGSVLVAMYGGGTIGNVGLLTFDSTVNQACCTISPYKFVYNKYLFYSLMAHREKLISFGGGGTQVNLSQGTIGNFIVGLPPYEEQHAIADYLDAKCSDIDNRIEVIDKTTEKYKALKKSLISEVVTGKRCVI